MITAIVIDNNSRSRRVIANILQSINCELVGTGETAADALQLYCEHTPDLVLFGINIPNSSDMKPQEVLLEQYPGAHVVLLTRLVDTTAKENTPVTRTRASLDNDSGTEELRVNIERAVNEIIDNRPVPLDPSAVPVENYTSGLIDILKRRASVRSFTSRYVSDAMVSAVLSAAQHAPTSSNMQAYSYVVVRDAETKFTLSELAGGQDHVAQCPVFVAVCADIHRLEDAISTGGGNLAKGHMELSLVATIDAALVGMAASLVAESLELGGCMIGGMRNQPEDVARVLGLPDGVFVAFGMTLGFPAERPQSKPRYPGSGVIHWERYEKKPLADLHQAYNASLEAQKQETGRADGLPWTERLAKNFSEPKRLNLRRALHNLGYDFD